MPTRLVSLVFMVFFETECQWAHWRSDIEHGGTHTWNLDSTFLPLTAAWWGYARVHSKIRFAVQQLTDSCNVVKFCVDIGAKVHNLAIAGASNCTLCSPGNFVGTTGLVQSACKSSGSCVKRENIRSSKDSNLGHRLRTLNSGLTVHTWWRQCQLHQQ